MNKLRYRRAVYAVGVLALGLPLCAISQDAAAPAVSSTAPQTRSVEPAVDDLIRRDEDTVLLTLPEGKQLLLHDFEWSGQVVRTSKLHLKQLAPGVVEITSVALNVGEWRFHVRDAANYYGLGERSNALNHAHEIVKNSIVSGSGAMGGSSSKPMPFFMSTTGYGLWVDATSDATFDMNGSNAQDITITVPAARLHIVLFPGPDFGGILERFTRTMGQATLPPYWAFAPWKARANDEETQAQVLDDVGKLRELNLPADVVLLDNPWTAPGTYSFDAKRFEDATAMSQRVHDSGFKMVAGVSPWMARNGATSDNDPYFVKQEDGSPWTRTVGDVKSSPIDLTSSTSRGWWQTQLRDTMKSGVDGYFVRDAGGGFGNNAKFTDGTDVRLMPDRYAMLASDAAGEIVDKDMKSDGAVLMESASEGPSAPGFVLAHGHRASFDPESGVPTLLNAALSAGMSGMPLWAGEMGAGRADTAVFERWAEFACFTPVMITTQGPWEFDQAAFDVYRKFATLHMSLFPYRYAAAVEAAKTGMPMMRALVLQYQSDEQARTARDEYLFGPDLLVAPVMDDSPSRRVYLPQGGWINYWTGAQVSGGKWLSTTAPIETVPVYARLGAVIPKLADDVQTLVQVSGSEARLHSLDGKRVYELVGPSAPTEIAITDFEGRKIVRAGSSLKLSDGPAARVIVRWRFAPVHSVEVNGVGVTLQNGKDGPFVEFDYSTAATVTWL